MKRRFLKETNFAYASAAVEKEIERLEKSKSVE
jgi:hypothetical protein